MSPEEMLKSFPDQLEWEKLDIDLSLYHTVTFCGMGGSGIVGDIAKSWLEHRGCKVPALTHRGYGLPNCVKGEENLVVCISYSGNTEETVSNFEEAMQRQATIVCVSSGGKLEELAKSSGVLHLKVPEGFAPRFALGYMLSRVLAVLGIDREEIEDARDNLKNSYEDIKNKGEEIANKLYGYIPVIYSTPLTEVAAFRWKTQINENSKTQAYFATLPEMHHNEVMGLENAEIRSKCAFVVMFDPKDHERVRRRVDITIKLLKDFGIVPIAIGGDGNSYLARTLHLIHVGDWASYYLAGKYGFEPLPVSTIERIKEELSKG
ncbi:bifunctional phosphoglucose/phosphomannose isomerase [Hydrogenivirga sp. 128-5-R1-1]|uniref:bifunctional phosphoglucose/phosphomannose isomerase n=1 Tax=Hydrogenivirga sp. 128-5-R1-1 TaxID=392423 RepID=UPI00015EFA15|nr:bifunctional phosphoglucose/phosphomannose isomerase [Hydrogenivirga sp. 128-5-R1-1]EDP75275.1 N(2),N(2)-dimethylguanosine tRNA methyltransferase [Hydrogenivirga sp. 128-5-R1-1]